VPETVRVHEYEKFSYATLGEGGAERLERATRALGAHVFDFYRHYAQAKQYVGLIKAGPHTVQILPKVYDGDAENFGYLLALLHYTRKLRIHPGEVAKLGNSGGSFLEVWIPVVCC
jgi:5-methylcytosine-specific restriction endonuclease McrBC regulatory subunit McrC